MPCGSPTIPSTGSPGPCSAVRTARWRWRGASGPGPSPSTVAILQPGQPVRRLQAVRHRQGDGQRRTRGVPGDQDVRDGGIVSRPLEGIRVLEVAMYGFVPSAGAVLAEWGADVIKVEHAVTGDPQRGCARPARFGSRATPTRTSSTPTAASAASGSTCRCPRATRCCSSSPAAPTCSSPASCPGTGRSSASSRRHPRGEPEDHLRPGQRTGPAR